MVRTKHLFITGVLLVGTIAAGILSVFIVQVPTIPIAALPAAVVLGTPAEEYPVVVDTYNTDTREAFIERVRSGYIPPPPSSESEPESVIYTPAPAALPVAIVEEPFSIATTTVSATSPDTFEISSTSTTETGWIASSTEDSTI